MLLYFQLLYYVITIIVLPWTVGSKGISVDLWRGAAFPKKGLDLCKQTLYLKFFKNTEPNWFDLQLVRARFEFFLNLKTYREHSRMQFFFFLRVPVFWSIAL